MMLEHLNIASSRVCPAMMRQLPRLALATLIASVVLLFDSGTAHAEQPLTKRHSINFDFQISDTHEHMEKLIRSANLEAAFDEFVSKNFNLEAPFSFYFFDEKSIAKLQPHQVAISYRTLNAAYQSILNKHPLQTEIQEQHFLEVVAFTLWRELGRSIFGPDRLIPLAANETSLDQFALIILMHFPKPAAQFLVDGIESFLLADNAESLPANSEFKSEMEFDEHRYRQMICIVIGADYHPTEGIVEELAWNSEKQKQCRESYRQALDSWLQALVPILKVENSLQQWRFTGQKTQD